MLRVAALFASLGVEKIRLTGGEPTLRPDLVQTVSALAQLPGITTLAMTTNGVLLPALLPRLLAAGLTHVNISLDTLRRERFASLSRRSPAHWDRAWEAIAAAEAQCSGSLVKVWR